MGGKEGEDTNRKREIGRGDKVASEREEMAERKGRKHRERERVIYM